MPNSDQPPAGTSSSSPLPDPMQDLPNPAAFRVPASDAKGHSDRIWARVIPGMKQQIGIFTGSKLFPYRTDGDLIRHAIYRHIQWLRSLGGDRVKSVMGQVDAVMMVLNDDERSSDFAAVFTKLDQQVSMHMGQGDVGQARRLVLQAWASIEEMPDDFWKDKHIREIVRKWGNFIENAPRANMEVNVAAEISEEIVNADGVFGIDDYQFMLTNQGEQ